MNQNIERHAPADGQTAGAPGGAMEARGSKEQGRSLLGGPAMGASIAGVVVFGAAVIFGVPEALRGAAAGVSVYAIHKRHPTVAAKRLPED